MEVTIHPRPIEDTLTQDIPLLLSEYRDLYPDSSAPDSVVEFYLCAAMEMADLYIACNPFIDDQGVITIPKSVRLGIYALASFNLDGSDECVQSEKSSRIAITYRTGEQVRQDIKHKYFSFHRINPGL